MQVWSKFAIIVGLGSALASAGFPLSSAQQSASAAQEQGQGQKQGRGMRGGFPGGGRGILGTVTETASDHYTIKTDSGEIYTIYYSVNTRIMKQAPGDPGGRRTAPNGRRNGNTEDDQANRPQPIPLKPSDIRVGDIITAGGEQDPNKKSIGAVFIAQVDPERAKQMREMQANYGKTWLAGRIIAVEGTTIKIDGLVDHAPHSIEVDENTSFRQRRDAITLADIRPGEQLRAEGAVKDGAFLATTVIAQQPRDQGPGGDNPLPPQ